MWYKWTIGGWQSAEVEHFPPLEQNRAFTYGDGLFESFVVGYGKPLWLQHHLTRLYSGARQIGLEMPVKQEELTDSLENFAHNQRQQVHEGAVWRLYAFRVSEGRYGPKDDRACLMLRTEPAPLPYPLQDPSPVRIGVAEQRKVPITLPEVKRMAALDYVLAAREARIKGWDDALMLNHQGRVVECSSSNIFLVKDQRILTPPLSEGCLPGVMRSLILKEFSTEVGLIPTEQAISLDDCCGANALLLSNARLGIRNAILIDAPSLQPSEWAIQLQEELQKKARQMMGINKP